MDHVPNHSLIVDQVEYIFSYFEFPIFRLGKNGYAVNVILPSVLKCKSLSRSISTETDVCFWYLQTYSLNPSNSSHSDIALQDHE